MCCSIGVYFSVRGTSVLLFIEAYFPDILYVKHFVVLGAFVINKCIFYSFQISVDLNHFANKSNNQQTCCSKTFISRVLTEVMKKRVVQKYLFSRVEIKRSKLRML